MIAAGTCVGRTAGEVASHDYLLATAAPRAGRGAFPCDDAPSRAGEHPCVTEADVSVTAGSVSLSGGQASLAGCLASA